MWTDEYDESMADEIRANDAAQITMEATMDGPDTWSKETIRDWIESAIGSTGIIMVESPGHAWAQVPTGVVEGMDLIITRCSPRNRDTIWLEEDQDLITFVVEVKAQFGIQLTFRSFKTSYIDDAEQLWRDNGAS